MCRSRTGETDRLQINTFKAIEQAGTGAGFAVAAAMLEWTAAAPA